MTTESTAPLSSLQDAPPVTTEARPEAKAAPEEATGTAPRRKGLLDSPYVAPVLITFILFVSNLNFGVLESYTKTLLAIVAAIVTEILLSGFFTGKFPHLASAYITGISVGIILRSPDYWPYIVCSVISIASKYLIRVKGRHIWNPSNFGLSVMIFLAATAVAPIIVQFDNGNWGSALIWALGSVIIWRLRRFHICATYVVSFICLAYIRSLITEQSWVTALAPITGPPYQLFILFMITDPKTTVKSKVGQCVVAFLVALAETIFRLNNSLHASYYALFLVGPAANLVEIWLNSRRETTATS